MEAMANMATQIWFMTGAESSSNPEACCMAIFLAYMTSRSEYNSYDSNQRWIPMTICAGMHVSVR